jgi:replicative DNA helicase
MSLDFLHISEVWAKAKKELVSPPRGVPLTWWPRLNEMVGGLRPNELTLLCAPTGAGKTQLLANISAQLLVGKEPHFIAPVETGDSDFVIRVVSCLEKQDLNMGEAISLDSLKVLDAKYSNLFIQKLFISNHDNRVEIEEMINILKFMRQVHGITVAILDNLNFFLKVVSSAMEKAEMDNAIHEFVILAKQIPIHIILVTHPKKTDDGRVVSEFDIKGSSTAVQESSNVVLFNRPPQKAIVDGRHLCTDRELVFRKIRRRGIHVGKPIWFAFENGRYLERKS